MGDNLSSTSGSTQYSQGNCYLSVSAMSEKKQGKLFLVMSTMFSVEGLHGSVAQRSKIYNLKIKLYHNDYNDRYLFFFKRENSEIKILE